MHLRQLLHCLSIHFFNLYPPKIHMAQRVSINSAPLVCTWTSILSCESKKFLHHKKNEYSALPALRTRWTRKHSKNVNLRTPMLSNVKVKSSWCIITYSRRSNKIRLQRCQSSHTQVASMIGNTQWHLETWLITKCKRDRPPALIKSCCHLTPIFFCKFIFLSNVAQRQTHTPVDNDNQIPTSAQIKYQKHVIS